MRYMMIFVFFIVFFVFCDVKQVQYEGIPLGVPLEGVKYEPLIDPITGEPFYTPFALTQYAEGRKGEYTIRDGKWIGWDYNADSTERVMRIENFYVPYLKDKLKKRFEKIKMRKDGKVNDSLYLNLKPIKGLIKLPKYDLHLQPEMKEEFMKIAKKNFLKRRPYRIKEDENGREMLITNAVDPFNYVITPEGKVLTQLGYQDTFYLDDIEKYGKIGEPILVHRLKGEPWDAVDVPLLFKDKVVAVAHFWSYGAEAWVPKDNLEWDKYPFVDIEEGRKLIEEDVAKQYEKEKILPFIQEIAYFEGGFSLFLCDEKKTIARWASPNTSNGTARVCFVAALLSNGEVLFINPMTKEVR